MARHVTNAKRRIAARKRIKRGAMQSVKRKGSIHYTQGGARWSAINNRRPPWNPGYYYDCSSHSTWLHWTATARVYGTYDYVNGYRWRAGYTGTQINHGKRLRKPSMVGDLVFYGGSRGVPAHVATYVGNGLVVSHGSEAGPLLVRWNYRSVSGVRRHLY